MSTDYDCWKDDEEAVTWEAILETFHNNATLVTDLLVETIPLIAKDADKEFKNDCLEFQESVEKQESALKKQSEEKSEEQSTLHSVKHSVANNVVSKTDVSFAYEHLIRNIPDFPKPGIQFKDITTLIKDPVALKAAIREMARPYLNKQIDVVVGAESRGFIFGTGIAVALGAGFVPARKPGKLPGTVRKAEYKLEYGTDGMEMHVDAITRGMNVLLVDDLIATGGTITAVAKLVEDMGGKVVGMSFLIDLITLHGKLDYDYTSLITYEVDE
jgi:adenine phosphoribosyltransferase